MGARDTRSTIMTRAIDLFADRGYDAVGVQEIVEAAGVTKPSLYHHFGSKRGLLEALLDAELEPLAATLRLAAEYRGDLTGTLERVVEAYFAFARSKPALYRMLLAFWFAPPHSDAFGAASARNERRQALLERLFVLATEQHGNMRGRQRAYAATFLGTIHTYAALGINGHVELDQPLVHQAVHQFMHGILS